MRYLFVTFDGGGNLQPELALAVRLRNRGHGVRFLAHASQRAAIERAGVGFAASRHAPDHDNSGRETSLIRDWELEDPAQMAALIRDRVAFGPAALYAADVARELERHPADAVAVDYWLFGALAAAERAGLPSVVLRHTCYGQYAWWNDGLPQLNSMRAEIGLPPIRDVFEQYRRANLELVLTSRSFDFAIHEPELPANVLHVGPQLEVAPGARPADPERPLVLVSLSTSYQAQEDVLRRIVDALSTLPVYALVTTGPAVALGHPLPANVDAVPWVPHGEVLPRATLVITHGGLGTVMAALAHGVPLLCLPMGRDQDGNAARATRLGAGIELPRDASPVVIADAVRAALVDPSLNRNAERIAAGICAEIAADRAVKELEALATT